MTETQITIDDIMSNVATKIPTKERKMKELKNGRSELLSFNTKKLESILEQRSFTPRQVSVMLDYNPCYLTKCIKVGKIGLTCVELLATRLGIAPSEYEVEGYKKPAKKPSTKTTESVKEKVLKKIEKREDEQKPIILQVQIDPSQLKDLIKEAVLDVFNSL